MAVNELTQTNFLYRFDAGGAIHTFTDLSHSQSHNNETYVTQPAITHTAPRFNGDAQGAEVDVTLHEDNPLADLFVNGPAPYPIKLLIYEYDRLAGTVSANYRGWISRVPFRLTDSKMTLRCKSAWHFYERDSLTASLSALSRYSVYDPRAGVDLEALKVVVTVTAMNDERDVLTVTGVTEIDGWFTGGMLVSPDRHKRTILQHITVGLDKQLHLNAPFPEFSLTTGFTADAYPGDDLTYETWANKFGALTNNGEAWGGWRHMPTVDPALRGVL